MIKGGLKYYILFENYEQGLALHDVLDSDDIPNRIAPAPRAIQGELSCGMSLLIEPAHIEQVRLSIEKHQAEYPWNRGQRCWQRSRHGCRWTPDP